MGLGNYRKGKLKNGLTREQIERKHRRLDGDGYIFDVEYQKLKEEQERIRAQYEKEREKYLQITEKLREEMMNGTATNADTARFMAVLSDRGVQLEQQQQKLQTEIDKLAENRAKIDNDMNELRKKAFPGSTRADYKPIKKDSDYKGFTTEKKYSKAQIVEMSPEEYLRRMAFGANGGGSLQAIIQSASPSTVENYMRKMLRGTKFSPPTLGGASTKGANNARVLAAMMNGYERIPVMILE